MLLFLASLLPTANAQCTSATYSSTCYICTTKLTTISATTLQNCHVNTPMANLLPDPPANNDIRPIVQQWGDYGRSLAVNNPSKLNQFCSFSALDTEQIYNVYNGIWGEPMTAAGKGTWTRDKIKTIYRNLGCFLDLTRGSAGYDGSYHFDNGVTGISWKLDLTRLSSLSKVYGLFVSVNSLDTNFIDRLTVLLDYTNGKNPFSTKVNQFGFYYIIYSLAKKSGADIANLQEHILYTDWTFMNFTTLTNAQKLSYHKYQTGSQTFLPKRGISSVFPLAELQSTCPIMNSYLTVGCMTSIACYCQTDSANCQVYFYAIDSSMRPVAKYVLGFACADNNIKSAYSVLCGNYNSY